MHVILWSINSILSGLAGCCFSNQPVRHIVITDYGTEIGGVLVTFRCIKLTYRNIRSAGSTSEASGQTDRQYGNIRSIMFGLLERKLSEL
jgi:hypothetical protein